MKNIKLKITYNIKWNDVINNFGWGNRPFYEVICDGKTLVSMKDGQLPYTVNNGSYIAEKLVIEPNSKQEFVINYSYSPDNNVDDGKLFYGIFEIEPTF